MKFVIHTTPKASDVAVDPESASQWRVIGRVSARTARDATAYLSTALDHVRTDADGELFMDDGERYLYVRKED